MRLYVELRRRLSQFRQNQQTQQESTDDVDRNHAFIVFRHRKRGGRDPRIFHYNIQSPQPVRTLRKLLDGFIAAKVESPCFHDARAPRGFFYGLLGSFVLLEAPDAKDDFGRVETCEVSSGFEAEAGVSASDDDGLVREVLLGVGEGDEDL